MNRIQKVLITGGAGFIGSHIAEYFARTPDAERPQVFILDNLRTGMIENLHGIEAQFVDGSVADADAVHRLAEGADVIFHLAAMVTVPESMQMPKACVDVNVQGTLNVLDAARAHRVGKVVFSSTCAVYGDGPISPKREDMMPVPLSPYGVTKLDGEHYLDIYRREYGLSTVSLRYFNVFGPRQDPRSQYAAVIPIFIQRAMQGEDLFIYGDGEQTRDFVFVSDVVAANVLAATSAGMMGTYNVAQGQPITINALAHEIKAAIGSTSRIKHASERPGDIRHSTADISKIAAAGFKPRVGFKEGLRRTIEGLMESRR